MTEKITFEPRLDELKMHEQAASKCGTFRVTRIQGGQVWEIWAYNPQANDWFVINAFFVERKVP